MTTPERHAGPRSRAIWAIPRLEVVFWPPERGDYVDSEGDVGRRCRPGRGSSVRHAASSTTGEPVAAIFHDRVARRRARARPLRGRRRAARARERATRTQRCAPSLRRCRSHGGASSRPGDEQRRRIERDIHDGAQQRLVALALELRATQRRLAARPTPTWSRALSPAVDELQLAVSELRELARGVHPAILTEDGPRPRRSSRSPARTPLPVERRRSRPTERLPPRDRGGGVLRRLRGARERRSSTPTRHVRQRSAPCAETGSSSSRSRTTASAERNARDRVRSARPRRPASRRSGGRLRRREPSRRPAPASDRGDAVRVVIADDSVLLREGLARVLADDGFEVVAQVGDADAAPRRRDRRSSPTSRSSTCACRRRFTDEGAARCAGAPRREYPELRILVLSQIVEAHHALRLFRDAAGGVRLPPQGPRRRDRRLPRGRAPGRPRAGPRSTPRSSAQLLRPPAARRPAGRADAARARGARPDGGRPLEPGDLHAGSSSARRRSRPTSTASSSSSDCSRPPTTIAASSPSSPTCAALRPDSPALARLRDDEPVRARAGPRQRDVDEVPAGRGGSVDAAARPAGARHEARPGAEVGAIASVPGRQSESAGPPGRRGRASR